ncbi:MAG: hypothetical protein QOE61_5129, partial [Micromonosporaceae bacterium]|nr:hypothetical protein [Micromonosporaceae bacterium]
LGEDHVGWDRFGLEILAVSESLPGLPDTVLLCEPPSRDGPDVRLALVRLLEVLASRLQTSAADDSQVLADRLAYDAAANSVRRAAGWLP